MFENYYTCEVSIKDGNLVIQSKIYKKVGGAFYQVKLDNISSVSTDEIPHEWLAATWSSKAWSSSSDAAKNLTIARSGQSPLWRIFYTEGTFVNPKTHNPAFLLYKHRNKCVTLVLKEPVVMTIQNINFGQRTQETLTEVQKATNVAVKEISFEVDNKEATAKSILDVLKGNINALPEASFEKMSKREFKNSMIRAMIIIFGIPIIIIILIVVLSILFGK
jgi:hypothetical protein